MVVLASSRIVRHRHDRGAAAARGRAVVEDDIAQAQPTRAIAEEGKCRGDGLEAVDLAFRARRLGEDACVPARTGPDVEDAVALVHEGYHDVGLWRPDGAHGVHIADALQELDHTVRHEPEGAALTVTLGLSAGHARTDVCKDRGGPTPAHIVLDIGPGVVPDPIALCAILEEAG